MTTMDATSADFTEWLIRNPQPAPAGLGATLRQLSPRTGGCMGAVRSRHRRLAGAAHPPFEMGLRPTASPPPGPVEAGTVLWRRDDATFK